MRAILLILICFITIGCRSDNRCSRETALLRAEILDLEDKYYLLKSNHDTAMSELNVFKGIPQDVIYDDPMIYEDELPIESLGSTGTSTPLIDPATSSQLVGYQQRRQADLNDPIRTLDDIRIDVPGDVKLTEVMIHQRITRGHDVDGRPGDEGMDLLIQPRGADGNVHLQSGELTVSIIDPAENPENQRIGFWKFLPSESELFFANDEFGNRGILLHLPWDQRTPQHQRLIVHVRLITGDGHTFKTSSEVRIAPPSLDYSPDDPQVLRWTKRDSRWISDQDHTSADAAQAKTAIQKPAWRPVR